MLKVLDRLHSWTGNWGWSIVLMTFLIQGLLLPLTFKSLKAMTMMKKLQPRSPGSSRNTPRTPRASTPR